MNEHFLALLGALDIIGSLAIAAAVGIPTLYCRVRSGSWWWDEVGDLVERGR